MQGPIDNNGGDTINNNDIDIGGVRVRRRVAPALFRMDVDNGDENVGKIPRINTSANARKSTKMQLQEAALARGGLAYYFRQPHVGVMALPPDDKNNGNSNSLVESLIEHKKDIDEFMTKCKTLKLICDGKMHLGWQTNICLDSYLQSPTCMLQKLDLSGNTLSDDTSQPLFNALLHNTSLKVLNCSGALKHATTTTWMAVSELIQSPTLKLESLNLCYSPIGVVALEEFARALSGNDSLAELLLYNDPEWNSNWKAFVRLLCNTTSIGATFDSNHTLAKVVDNKRQPKDLDKYLKMNEGPRKADVARSKVIMFHFSGDTNADINEHFVDMKEGVLPHAVAWMTGGGVSFLYRFMRDMPFLFDHIGK